jgi:hypothetical protein
LPDRDPMREGEASAKVRYDERETAEGKPTVTRNGRSTGSVREAYGARGQGEEEVRKREHGWRRPEKREGRSRASAGGKGSWNDSERRVVGVDGVSTWIVSLKNAKEDRTSGEIRIGFRALESTKLRPEHNQS